VSSFLSRPRGERASDPPSTSVRLADILRLNDWLRKYTSEIHAPVADYYSALLDSHGMLREGYSDDGLHPNDRGYMVTAPVAEGAILRALKE
jgi:lysophospholipase L1-like esterase